MFPVIARSVSDEAISFFEAKKSKDERIKGDHHIFTKPDIIEIINIQPLGDRKAKAYQVKQVRNLILKYKLHKER